MLYPKETSVGIFAYLEHRERAKTTNTPWLVHYPSDVPKQLPPISFSNLPELLRTAVQTYDKKVAFTQVMPNGMNGSLT